MRKMKFQLGEKIIGKDIKGEYRNRSGTVIGYKQETHDYQVKLEDGSVHFVSPSWFDKIR